MYNNVRNDVTDYAVGGSPKIWKSKSLKNEILFCLQKKKIIHLFKGSNMAEKQFPNSSNY